MSNSARFALHRPEFVRPLERGEAKISALLKGSAFVLEAGRTLIEADTEHQFVYRLLDGWAARTRGLEDGRSQCILVFLPGDLFAVKGMFVTRHTDTVQALSKIVAERIDRRDLYQAYARDSDVAARCTWQILEEESRLHSWIVGLGQGTAEERLAMLLLEFQGRLVVSDTSAGALQSYLMPLTQGQLADHLGITAVHVNRVLKSFREGGMVTVRAGRVSITDPAALARRAAPLLNGYEGKIAASQDKALPHARIPGSRVA
jgi:CRP/FNR family transcriptional regulator, anaerobic regulatory protein